MTIMKGLNEGIACCVPRRRDTLQLQLNTNLGLAWLHCLAMASLGQRNSVVTIGAGRWGLGARMTETNKQITGSTPRPGTGRMSPVAPGSHTLLWTLDTLVCRIIVSSELAERLRRPGLQTSKHSYAMYSLQAHFLLVLHEE